MIDTKSLEKPISVNEIPDTSFFNMTSIILTSSSRVRNERVGELCSGHLLYAIRILIARTSNSLRISLTLISYLLLLSF